MTRTPTQGRETMPTRETARRASILHAARSLFCGGPYDDVSLRDIAAAVGVDVGQIMREFGSKEALFAVALEDAISDVTPISDTWAQQVASELVTGASSRNTGPFRMLALSGASAKASWIVKAQIGALEERMARYLTPGADLSLRAAVAIALIVGFTLTRRLVAMPTNGATGALAENYIVHALEGLRVSCAKAVSKGRASSTRAAIIEAAESEFTRLGFDGATVRGIATEAGADPALVLRYFGSKENLFLTVLKAHFNSDFAYPSWEMIRSKLLEACVGDAPDSNGSLVITLRSISSPVARDILKHDIDARFLGPLTKVLGAPAAKLRANLVLSITFGLSFCQNVMPLSILKADSLRLRSYLNLFMDLVEIERGVFSRESIHLID